MTTEGSGSKSQNQHCLGSRLVGSALGSDSASAVRRDVVVDRKVASLNPLAVRKPSVCYMDLDVESVWINV